MGTAAGAVPIIDTAAFSLHGIWSGLRARRAKDNTMSALPILADFDWFYVAGLYALIFFSALIVTLALIWDYLALHL